MNRRTILIVLGVVIVGVGAWAAADRFSRPTQPEADPVSFELPRNADPAVGLVGTMACAECHAAQYKAWSTTQHARSLATLDPAAEPIPATFHHKRSDIHYEMREKDGAMWMRAYFAKVPGLGETTLSDHPIDYVIGSGTHTRSYLCELDGFMVQAPATWYRSKDGWDVSPGYDRSTHFGFRRPVGSRCLICHVGKVEAEPQAINRVKILEPGVGCERCHGAGELHAEFHSEHELPPGAHDDTIIHPGRLTRTQQMDLCAQCHLDHTITVMHEGKRFEDWRPGMPWESVQTTYRPTTPAPGMTVVGHIDQLRASACFKQTETMSCITCHDPHHTKPIGDKIQYYNAICAKCHDACADDEVQSKTATGSGHGVNCVECHMPSGDTDIPHVAFTHHRIGIHDPDAAAPHASMMPTHPGAQGPGPGPGDPAKGAAPTKGEPAAKGLGGDPFALAPVNRAAHRTRIQRMRDLGLAYMLAARHARSGDLFREFMGRSHSLLQDAHDEGQRDATLLAALGRHAMMKRQGEKAFQLSVDALAAPDADSITPDTRAEALAIIANKYVADMAWDKAKEHLEELTRLRRTPEDHLRLAMVHQHEEQRAAAAAAARRAVDIWPNEFSVLFDAANYLEWAGHAEEAARLRQLGQAIQVHQSKPVARPGRDG